jgi:hypothetical protein
MTTSVTQTGRDGRHIRNPAAGGFVNRHMEHRWGWRRPCRARVCLLLRGTATGFGKLRDVSMSGAFLETGLSLPMFTQLALAVVLDDGSHCGEFRGTVVRREPAGFGIEWSEPVAGSICDALGCGASCGHAAGTRGT